MNEPKALSVREAFAKAGHPVPEGASVRYYANDDLWVAEFESGIDSGMGDGRLIGGEAEFDDGWGETSPGVGNSSPKLDNLPAADAYDELPECVQKVVER